MSESSVVVPPVALSRRLQPWRVSPFLVALTETLVAVPLASFGESRGETGGAAARDSTNVAGGTGTIDSQCGRWYDIESLSTRWQVLL